MKCAFCGREVIAEVGKEESCGQCSGGCRKIHCPHCGYANPQVPGYLKRWMKKDDDSDLEA